MRFVDSAIGSLHDAVLRFAGESSPVIMAGPMEIGSLSGIVTADGRTCTCRCRDRNRRVWRGHVVHGNIARTTVEALIVTLPEWPLGHERDPGTGYPELVVRRRSGHEQVYLDARTRPYASPAFLAGIFGALAIKRPRFSVYCACSTMPDRSQFGSYWSDTW